MGVIVGEFVPLPAAAAFASNKNHWILLQAQQKQRQLHQQQQQARTLLQRAANHHINNSKKELKDGFSIVKCRFPTSIILTCSNTTIDSKMVCIVSSS
jgi:hypothetical protein